LGGGCGTLDVAGEAAVDAGPGEGALDHPALGLHDEAGVGSPDDLDGTGRGLGDPRALVAGIREEPLDERKRRLRPIDIAGSVLAGEEGASS
jgi:hypothetical protein